MILVYGRFTVPHSSMLSHTLGILILTVWWGFQSHNFAMAFVVKAPNSLRWFMHPLFSCWISMDFPASNVWWQFIGYPSKALAPGFSCSATPMNLGSSTAHGWRHIPKRPTKWNWEGWGSTYRTSDLTNLTKGRLQKISTKKNTWIWYHFISF